MKQVVKWLFALAAVWSALAGLVLLLVPFGMSTEASSNGQVTTRPVSFFEMQGWWGVFVLVIFAAVYYGPLRFYQGGNRLMSAVFAIAAIILSVLAGFSIGLFYWIGSLGLLAGLVLLPLAKDS